MNNKEEENIKVTKENQGWQICPICNGSGIGQSEATLMPVCNVCNGKKIISTTTGLPPN